MCFFVFFFKFTLRIFKIVNNITENATLSKKQRFILVASDRESLKLLITTFNRKKKSVFAVEKLLAIEQNKKLSLKGLSSMYSQWKKFSER